MEENILKNVLFLIILVTLCTFLVASDEMIVEAAKNGDLQTVKTILAKDPSKLNATDDSKYTALHWACMRAHWDVAKYLIEKGADLNVAGEDEGTQINWAVHHDNVEIIKLMVEKGAKLNIRNQWGMTELHTAIWRGCIHVVEYLLDHGSDPMIKTNEGWTAMHYAYRSGHDNVIEMLGKRGLSMTEKDNMGRTPQYLYFKKPNPIELSPKELDEYIGKYYIGDYLILEIWREGNRLKIIEFGPDEIYPAAKDFFYFKQAPWTLIFTRDEDGKIHHGQLSFIRRSYTIVRKNAEQHSFPVPKDSYLGQQPHGMMPELFVPGIFTTDTSEECSMRKYAALTEYTSRGS
jgi:hypothetical protein